MYECDLVCMFVVQVVYVVLGACIVGSVRGCVVWARLLFKINWIESRGMATQLSEQWIAFDIEIVVGEDR